MPLSTHYLSNITGEAGNKLNRLIICVVFMNLGDGIARSLYPLLMKESTGSAFFVSMIGAVQNLPVILFSVIFGAWIDRMDPEKGANTANWIRFALLFLMALAAFTGMLSPWIIIGCLFLISSAEIFVDTAVYSLVPRIVGHSALARVNSKITFLQILMGSFIGKPVGSSIFGLGTTAAIGAHSLFFLAACFPFTTISWLSKEREPSVHTKVANRGNMWDSIKTGAKFVYSTKLLFSLMIITMVLNLSVSAVNAVFVFLVTGKLGLSSWMFGFILCGFAVGGIIGSYFLPIIRSRFSSKFIISATVLVQAIGFYLMGQALGVWDLLFISSTLGFSASVFFIEIAVLQQRITPPDMLGRICSLSMLTGVGLMPFGSLIGGFAADAVGITAVYSVSALAIFFVFVFSLTIDFSYTAEIVDTSIRKNI